MAAPSRPMARWWKYKYLCLIVAALDDVHELGVVDDTTLNRAFLPGLFDLLVWGGGAKII